MEERLQEQTQASHYDAIIADYDRHYGDPFSTRYRQRFFFEPMFKGYSLNGHQVLDAMCGSGDTTRFLLEKGAIVTGLDISPQCIQRYSERWERCTALCRSILDTGASDNQFDYVCINGGLHHLSGDALDTTFNEIARILKPGGLLCFMEPHKGSVLDYVRNFWYKADPLFAENESALDFKTLEKKFCNKFKIQKMQYFGNLAYLLVWNSMVFRVPYFLKRIYSPLLIEIEDLLNRSNSRVFSCAVIGQWIKI